MPRVLVTGSEGLVGTDLCAALAALGWQVRGLDLRAQGDAKGDVCDVPALERALAGCVGVVHLAAVSRVIFGEREPQRCMDVNVGGTRAVIAAAQRAGLRWMLFASSREVYGQPDTLPCPEDAPLIPVNVYGRAKIEGEKSVSAARGAAFSTAIVRLSNVYGRTSDHADRVVPAFARAASEGGTLRIDGESHTFDFTHIDDTTRGLVAMCEQLDRGGYDAPPIHLLTGEPVTLGELARLAIELAKPARAAAGLEAAKLVAGPEREFDVARFWGDPSRAKAMLGWSAEINLRQGLAELIREFAALP